MRTRFDGPGPDSLSMSRVLRKDHIVSPRIHFVAGKAGFMLALVDGFAIDEATESPSGTASISLRVFDHDLNGCGRARDESLR